MTAQQPMAVPTAPPSAPGQSPLAQGVRSATPPPPPVTAEDCVGCASAVPPWTATGDGFSPTGLDSSPWQTGPTPRHWLLRQFDLRHSSTHGRAMGPGEPLRGTSWLNRPFSVSLDVGGLLMADRPAPNVRAGNDLVAAVGIGWDWDHYWGSQVRVAWSTPELLNTLQTSVESDDNLLVSDLSLLYYPWGDSRTRPYWRIGVGLTDIEYMNDLGRQNQDMVLTIPLGVGVKRQLSRKLAWRLEFVDNIAFGQNETGSMNNFTLTTGLEWRLGGHGDKHWAWAPRYGGW